MCSVTNLDCILKSRDITLPTKFHLVKAVVFLVLMYTCESWTIQKTKCQRTDAFEVWYWRTLLRVPWTARRSNQSILKEISPKYSLEGLILKLKLQYFGHLLWRASSLEKTLMLGKIEGRRRRGIRGWDGWIASPVQWTCPRDSERQGNLVYSSPWGRKESDIVYQLNNTISIFTVLHMNTRFQLELVRQANNNKPRKKQPNIKIENIKEN